MKIRKLITTLLFLGGVILLAYPNVNVLLSNHDQTIAVKKYNDKALHYDKAMVKKEIDKAKVYNKSILGTEVHDPFVPGSGVVIPDNYNDIMNVASGIMGTLEIPCIDLNLPIYHGVAEKVIRKGVGHLRETPFPIGGKGNHTVLSTHRGLPEAKLFTDLDKLEIGDEFYIHIYNQVLAYKVDKIIVVKPNKTEYLKPIADEDHVTLLTCTPYGINSHRLLVRGIRTKYIPKHKAMITKKTWPKEIIILLVLTGALVLMIGYKIVKKVRSRKNETKIS